MFFWIPFAHVVIQLYCSSGRPVTKHPVSVKFTKKSSLAKVLEFCLWAVNGLSMCWRWCYSFGWSHRAQWHWGHVCVALSSVKRVTVTGDMQARWHIKSPYEARSPVLPGQSRLKARHGCILVPSGETSHWITPEPCTVFSFFAWLSGIGALQLSDEMDHCRHKHVSVQESVYVKFVSESAAGQGFKALHGWMYDGMDGLCCFLAQIIYSYIVLACLLSMFMIGEAKHQQWDCWSVVELVCDLRVWYWSHNYWRHMLSSSFLV